MIQQNATPVKPKIPRRDILFRVIDPETHEIVAMERNVKGQWYVKQVGGRASCPPAGPGHFIGWREQAIGRHDRFKSLLFENDVVNYFQHGLCVIVIINGGCFLQHREDPRVMWDFTKVDCSQITKIGRATDGGVRIGVAKHGD